MGLIVGIDPGLANTAMVAIENGRIVLSRTITTKGAGKPTFETVMQRGTTIADKLLELFDPLRNVTVVPIEGYEDFGGGYLRKRKKKGGEAERLVPNRWTTPAVCALIGAKLSSRGYTVVWQSPRLVMTRYAAYKSAWATGRTGLFPGDELITNDHERSAACHALAWIDAHKGVVST